MSEHANTYNDQVLAQARDELLELLLQEEEHPGQQAIPAIHAGTSSLAAPLSFAQRRLWFFDRKEPGNPVYNLPYALRLKGPLQVEVLKQSIQAIIQRHAVLRTTFLVVDGVPQQRVAEEVVLHMPLEDVQDGATPLQEEILLQSLTVEARRAFDLEHGPLIRSRLLRLGQDYYILLLVFHHSIFDGWSRELLLRELAAFYEAFLANTTPRLVELPLQYTDFASWQQRDLDAENTRAALEEYWRQQLDDLPVLELPTDRPRPARQTYDGATFSFIVPQPLCAALRALSQREGTTLFMTLLGAFQVLLYRYTGQDDIVIGTPIANRSRVELEHLIGFFVNMLVIRTRVEATTDFLTLLRQVRETTLGAYAHQDFPFERLVEMLRPLRDPGRSPLYQIVFILQNLPAPRIAFGDLTATSVKVPLGVSKGDLTLELLEKEQELTGSIEYNTALFDAESIQRLAAHWLMLLEGIVRDPRQPLFSLPLLTPEERQQILSDWNATSSETLPERLFQQVFTEQATRTPDAAAICWEEGILTYQALEQFSNQLAHYLHAQGVTTDMPVGVYLDHTAAAIIGILGIFKAGGCYVPLDPATPPERLTYMLHAAAVQVVVSRQKLLEQLPVQVASAIAVDTSWPEIRRETREPGENCVEAHHLAYLIFTSGTAGRPKGVRIEHRGLVNMANVQYSTFGVGPTSRVLQFASLNFDASVWEITMALLCGASLYLCSAQDQMTGVYLHNTLRKQAITHLTFTPSTLAVLPAGELPDLQVIISAGEALTPELAERWAGNYHLFNAYGPTEATVCATIGEYRARDRMTIGRPIANTQVYLLDPYLQPVPVGVAGELYISGIGLARGYLGGADERFLPHPFSIRDQERLYRTGDLARYTVDGAIEYLGRIDQQVKIRGFRVEPGEVENLLLQHPAVLQCHVRAYTRSPGDISLLAYIVLDDGQEHLATGLEDELRAYLRSKVPGYMLPSDFYYVQRLPLNTHGKIDQRALPVPAVRERDRVSAGAYAPPQTPLEQVIARCWQEALHMDQVSLHDNFFDLGGHSLLTIQIQSRLQEALRREIDLVDLFTYTTISALAQALSASSETANVSGERTQSKRTVRTAQMREQQQLRTRSRTMKE